ncbi:MAG: hypothetical protein ACI4EN_02840 [Butyrivibrio sp.]
MSDFEEVQAYIVGGYQFESREEYETALQEKKGVEYLDSQADYKDIGKVFNMYCELLDKGIFYTPVGLDYLRKLRSYLAASGKIDKNKIPPLLVPSGNKKQSARIERYISGKYSEKVKELDKKIKKEKNKSRTSILLNIILFLMIIGMFFILSTSSNPTILNYERVIQDKYASWADDLKDKEKELREWERELEERESDVSQN